MTTFIRGFTCIRSPSS